jgi:hypothetical protein
MKSQILEQSVVQFYCTLLKRYTNAMKQQEIDSIKPIGFDDAIILAQAIADLLPKGWPVLKDELHDAIFQDTACCIAELRELTTSTSRILADPYKIYREDGLNVLASDMQLPLLMVPEKVIPGANASAMSAMEAASKMNLKLISFHSTQNGSSNDCKKILVALETASGYEACHIAMSQTDAFFFSAARTLLESNLGETIDSDRLEKMAEKMAKKGKVVFTSSADLTLTQLVLPPESVSQQTASVRARKSNT